MSITINGKTYNGNSVSIVNGRVYIDGKESLPGEEGKEINIVVTGNIENLEVDACQKILVTGNVGKVKTVSGDVDVNGNITGDVQTTSGDIECEKIDGSIQTTSGDVSCGNVGGSVKTLSGDIKHRKTNMV